jgi:hypothetical protein
MVSQILYMDDGFMHLKIKVNIGKNRLYFTFSGRAVKEEMDKLYTDVRFSVADLRSGFDVISDFSECTLINLTGISTFRKIMNYLISNGVGEIVRIMNKNSIVYKQIVNLSSRICGYSPIYVSTLEEAEEKLEKTIKRNGIRFHVINLPVEYNGNDMKGKGNISNLSISGCAIESATLPVSVNENISIKVEFKDQDISPNEFEIKARVVRADDGGFAAQFKDIDNDKKDELWKCLIHETQLETDFPFFKRK